MNPDLDTLATRVYVTIDGLLLEHPQWAPERPAVGIVPMLTDAELITLAVIQALLGFTSEARFIGHARTRLVCSQILRSDPRTTSVSVTPRRRCSTSSRRSPATARRGTTTWQPFPRAAVMRFDRTHRT